MVSVIAFFSDEAIEESKTKLDDLTYILTPNGGLMSSVCIPPAETLIMHLTDTLNIDSIIISYNEITNIMDKDKVLKYLSVKEEDTEINNYYFLINTKDEILGHFNFNVIFKYSLDKSIIKLLPYIKNDYFLLVNEIKYKDENNKLDMLNYIYINLSNSYDIVVFNKEDLDRNYIKTSVNINNLNIYIRND